MLRLPRGNPLLGLNTNNMLSKLYNMFRFTIGTSLIMSLTTNVSVCDAPIDGQYSFQDPASPMMEGIINLHHHIMLFLVFIIIFVFWILSRTLWLHRNNPNPSSVAHGTVLEIVWTVTPSLILLFIAVPSFSLLYSLDDIMDPEITYKAIGHQWYWSYEYPDLLTPYGEVEVQFDSYMVTEGDLYEGELRLLETDNRVVVPVGTNIRLLVTAADVIHSWAVPSLGIKVDAVPGRLNQVAMLIQRPGVFYGQCSEICGVNHGFMPIVVEAVPMNEYISWLESGLDSELNR